MDGQHDGNKWSCFRGLWIGSLCNNSSWRAWWECRSSVQILPNTTDPQSVEEASDDDAQREFKYWASSQIQSHLDNSLDDLERSESIKWRLVGHIYFSTTQGPEAETYEHEVLKVVEEQYLLVVLSLWLTLSSTLRAFTIWMPKTQRGQGVFEITDWTHNSRL